MEVGFVEILVGALIAGMGGVLSIVGLMAYSETRLRPLGLTAAGFAVTGAGGAAVVAANVLFPADPGAGLLPLAVAVLAAIGLFYSALLANRS